MIYHYRYWNRYRIDTMADMQLKSILSLSILQWNSTAVLLLCIVQVLIRRKGFFDFIGSISLTPYHGSSRITAQLANSGSPSAAHVRMMSLDRRAAKQKTAAVLLRSRVA